MRNDLNRCCSGISKRSHEEEYEWEDDLDVEVGGLRELGKKTNYVFIKMANGRETEGCMCPGTNVCAEHLHPGHPSTPNGNEMKILQPKGWQR